MAGNPNDIVTRHVLIVGINGARAHNVSYRAWLIDQAMLYNFDGWTRNLADGVTVEAVIRGPRHLLEGQGNFIDKECHAPTRATHGTSARPAGEFFIRDVAPTDQDKSTPPGFWLKSSLRPPQRHAEESPFEEVLDFEDIEAIRAPGNKSLPTKPLDDPRKIKGLLKGRIEEGADYDTVIRADAPKKGAHPLEGERAFYQAYDKLKSCAKNLDWRGLIEAEQNLTQAIINGGDPKAANRGLYWPGRSISNYMTPEDAGRYTWRLTNEIIDKYGGLGNFIRNGRLGTHVYDTYQRLQQAAMGNQEFLFRARWLEFSVALANAMPGKDGARRAAKYASIELWGEASLKPVFEHATVPTAARVWYRHGGTVRNVQQVQHIGLEEGRASLPWSHVTNGHDTTPSTTPVTKPMTNGKENGATNGNGRPNGNVQHEREIAPAASHPFKPARRAASRATLH